MNPHFAVPKYDVLGSGCIVGMDQSGDRRFTILDDDPTMFTVQLGAYDWRGSNLEGSVVTAEVLTRRMYLEPYFVAESTNHKYTKLFFLRAQCTNPCYSKTPGGGWMPTAYYQSLLQQESKSMG